MLRVDIITRILLLILSLASFLPQLRRIHALRNYNGISLIYILLNLIVATEQFALGLHLIAVGNKYSFAHHPPSLGDWLNVFQFGIVWLGHVAIFSSCLRLPPPQSRLKTTAVIAYSTFVLISLAPVAMESTFPVEDAGGWSNRAWVAGLFIGFHGFYISPVVTLLGIASLYFQARETWSRTPLGAISLVGLAAQAIIFALVGFAWIFRLTAPHDFFEGLMGFDFLIKWYQLVGWATVDNLVFAFVQAVLFCIALRRRGEQGTADEATQLLR